MRIKLGNTPYVYWVYTAMATYEIKAVADFWNGQQWNQDTAITTVDVCQPDLEMGRKGIEKNLFGFSEVTAHYFNGSAITMEEYCSVSNGANQDASITGTFRHTNNADRLNPKEKEFANTLKHRGFTFHSSSDWSATFFDFPTTLKLGEEWDCSAYIRIEAAYGRFPKVDWFGGANNTFDHNDHR